MTLHKLLLLIPFCLTFAAMSSEGAGDAVLATAWTVDGAKREALVVAPSKPGDGLVPVVLVFHGHGGTMQGMERKGFQRLWPQAVVVCPQGLPTPSGLDPEGKRSGWQLKLDDTNRDVKFVDAILKTLRQKYKIDDGRIFATGHSNGGGFTYLLWGARGKEFAAIAPSAGGTRMPRTVKDLKPLPVLHIAGEKDDIVPYESQKRTMEAVRKLNGCDSEGQPWARAGNLVGTLYPSKTGAPFVSVIHPGTHKYPDAAPELIIRFFKEVSKKG